MTQKSLTFSELANVCLNGDEEWFDPTLILDTPLCIDPFLLLDLEAEDEFKGAHEEIIGFFNKQFEILAAGGGDRSSAATKHVLANMRLPEVPELCLGYSEFGVAGSGSGAKLANQMVGAMLFAIGVGLKKVDHFEEISILRTGVGPDRICDATANIIKWRLAAYTTRVARSLKVPLTKRVLDKARFDLVDDRWQAIEAELPVDPTSGRAVLLVPRRFLRHLPTLGGDEFKEYTERKYVEAHKDELNRGVISKADVQKIVHAARQSEAARGEFIRSAMSMTSHPYDFDADPWGLISWEEPARAYVSSNPFQMTEPTDPTGFQNFVNELVDYFRHFIEDQKGWQLLWNDNGRPRRESAAQRVFLAVAWLTCREHDISIDPETNVGRGPVDFKFSRGFRCKALVETKLASNTRWLHGVTTQLPTYLNADKAKHGVFVLVKHNDRHDGNLVQLQGAADDVRNKQGFSIRVTIVDATRDKPSASKA